MTITENPGIALLKENICRLVPHTDEEFDFASQFFKYRKYKKKDHWLLEGEICTEVVFIIKGCLRYYLVKDGAERTTEIFFENKWFTDFESWLTKRPIGFYVDALEETEVLSISFRDLEAIYDRYPKCERIGRLIAESTIIHLCNRFNSLMRDSPQERYIKMLEEQPEIIDRIPQYYIASYLGIEPESLSRIRRKILCKAEA